MHHCRIYISDFYRSRVRFNPEISFSLTDTWMPRINGSPTHTYTLILLHSHTNISQDFHSEFKFDRIRDKRLPVRLAQMQVILNALVFASLSLSLAYSLFYHSRSADVCFSFWLACFLNWCHICYHWKVSRPLWPNHNEVIDIVVFCSCVWFGLMPVS